MIGRPAVAAERVELRGVTLYVMFSAAMQHYFHLQSLRGTLGWRAAAHLGAVFSSCLIFWAAQPAHAQERSITITDFFVYPAGAEQLAASDFAWPQAEQLNALVRLRLDGFPEPVKVDVFLAILDSEGGVVGKFKLDRSLAAGKQELVFDSFMQTGEVFGAARFTLELELSAKGAEAVQAKTEFRVSGPPLPSVQFFNLKLRNPRGGSNDTLFEPGDEFVVEGEFEVGENIGGVVPSLMLYALMDEDNFVLDPFYASQPFTLHWDQRRLEQATGRFAFQARGRLPFYFAEPHEYRHPFRVYVIVSFAPGAEVHDSAVAELSDNDYGEPRQSDEVVDRLIELERNINWLVRHWTPEVEVESEALPD